MRYDELAEGQTARVTKRITMAEIDAFIALTGDDNPLHHDVAYAESTRFGGLIGHGMLTAGLVSTVLGTRLPGPGCVYLGQTLRFVSPVYPGDEITATAEVVELYPERRHARLRTVCTNQRGEIVIEGEARMKLLA